MWSLNLEKSAQPTAQARTCVSTLRPPTKGERHGQKEKLRPKELFNFDGSPRLSRY